MKDENLFHHGNENDGFNNDSENQNEYNKQQKLRNFPIKIDNETLTHAERIKDISKDVPKDLN